MNFKHSPLDHFLATVVKVSGYVLLTVACVATVAIFILTLIGGA